MVLFFLFTQKASASAAGKEVGECLRFRLKLKGDPSGRSRTKLRERHGMGSLFRFFKYNLLNTPETAFVSMNY